ncbi:MAG: hypothetical protein WD963_01365 [Candidatus Paceibacterota bacterium]
MVRVWGWGIGPRAVCEDGRDLVEVIIYFGGSKVGEAVIRLTLIFDRGDPLDLTFKVQVTLPPGCTSTQGYSTTTGQPCGG